ncbi:sterol desaturase family protein [Zhongshania aquimaris]|uniref:Sterol desaturase family protein n=1 Tax=Zhongshania aquimaris TaxID=2857107 RepID=A0ABS6VUI9_9GAMM|nr:sterol desaturase family protein [Zhongshania aquimaris]MBW2941994.1 sterol desaturase family protein [Zhongshania aquimaris]
MSIDSDFSYTPIPIPTTLGETLRGLFSHASTVILASLAVGLIVTRIIMGNWTSADLIGPLLILCFWPFQEWLIHVHLLHYKPRKIFGKVRDFPLANKHRQHHKTPNDLSDITIKWQVYPIVVPVLFALNFLIYPSPELAVGALATFFTLAFNYEWSHYLAHVNWQPPLEYYRRRQRQHRLHHFRHEQMWWGVSMGLADTVLGTSPEPHEVQRSPTINNVHGLFS